MDTPAFDPARFIRFALRSLVVCCLALVMSITMVKLAQAAGTVPASPNYCLINYFNGGPTCGFSSAAAACVAVGAMVQSDGRCLSPNGYYYYYTYGSSGCPANSTGTTTCTCTDPYVPDSAGTSCVPVPSVTCPVDKLTAPPFGDACAEVLENINSTQAQKDAACGALTDKLKTGMACFSDKLSRTNDLVTGNPIPLVVTSDIRDIAYQAHLREIWDKMEELVRLMKNSPAMQTACAARRAEIAAEKGCDKAGPCKSKKDEVCYAESATQRSHCLIGRPANPNPDDAQHTQGKAFDVSRTYTINPLQAALEALRPPETIPQFLDNPTNCNLNWGGTFTDNYDPIHFYVR